MPDILKPDVCIIGAGSGGLSVAYASALIGGSVILIEENKMGGECLNNGCVPSKSLIEAARVANISTTSDQFGVHFSKPEVDFKKVHDHIHNVISSIAPNDSIERYTKLGVKVIQGHGQFLDSQTVTVGDQKIQAKYFVIASGSKPSIPPIPGLESVNYLTNETIFNLEEKPERLLVIGGGPIGCEIAQAYAMLGTPVALLEIATILPRDDQQFVDLIRNRFAKDNIDLMENIKITNISQQDKTISIKYSQGNITKEVTGTHLFVATGRRANIGKLNLSAANIVFNEKGLELDARLRTSNKKVFAIGDAAGRGQFTHLANYHASIIIKNIFFKIPAKADNPLLPWVSYTNPELAQVGLTEQQARAKNLKITVLTEDFSNNDRAQADHQTHGKIKVIADQSGKILGVSILANQAGELLFPWIVAMHNGLTLKSIATMMAPYPTISEINKRVASNYYLPKLSSRWTRLLVKLLKLF